MNIRFISAITLLFSILFTNVLLAEEAANPGRDIAFDRQKGNCLSCHMIVDAELPGSSGPPLLQMALRFPDRAALKAQIWDAGEQNPDTVMPPYGKHNILTDAEIDLVVDYLLTL